MSYMEILNDFHRWLRSNYLPGNARLLYYSLLAVFNEAGWPESIQVDNYRLMSMIDVRTERVAISARDKLVDIGFIRYSRGKKGCPNTYFLTRNTIEKVSQFDSESGSVSGSVSVSQFDSQLCSHIKTKTKTKESPLPPALDFGPELQSAFSDWLAYKQEKRQGYKPTGLRSLVTQVQKHAQQHGEAAVAALIRECMASNWQGIIWDKLNLPGAEENQPTPHRTGRLTVDENGEEVVRFD